MQVKSWLGASPITDQCLSVDAADLALRPSLSNHPWFLRFPSEKQKSASRKNLFRLEAPWPPREIQSWDLAAVTRTLTYENYAVFIPNGVRRVKRFLQQKTPPRGPMSIRHFVTPQDSLPSRQLVLDDLYEAFERLGAREQPPVHEEGRGAGHAGAGPLINVFLHRSLVFPAAEALLESCQVQAHLLCVRLELLRAGLWRVLIQLVMVGPELALVIRAPRGLVRLPRRRVQLIYRVIPMDHLHLLAVPRKDLGQRWLDPLAKGAVEVLELHDCHRRCGRTLEWCAVRRHLGPKDRRGLEMDHHLGLGAKGL